MFDIDTIVAAAVADEQTELANEAGNTCYGVLRDHALGYGSKETFEASLLETETAYMQEYMSNEKSPATETKPERWKWSKLPKKYRSAKSVVGTALDMGLNIRGKGKSEIEREIKEHKKQSLSDYDKFVSVMGTAAKIWAKMDNEEKQVFPLNLQDYFNYL